MAQQPMGYRGRQVLAFVESSHARNGIAPSYGQIAAKLGMTTADVCRVVRRLEQRGLLQRRGVGHRRNRGWHSPVIVPVG
jgi:DNA-binding MarR family transcriptional regulator